MFDFVTGIYLIKTLFSISQIVTALEQGLIDQTA